MRGKLSSTACLYALLLLFFIWYVLAALFKLPFIPSPISVVLNTVDIFLSQMVIHAGYSLWRIFAGILLSVVIGVPVGLCMGYFSSWDRLLSPLIYFVYPIPKIALMPVIMLLFGLGEGAKITMITLIVVFQVAVTARDAAKGIPKETYHTLYSLGAGNGDIFRRAVIPASLPGILSALRVSLATSLSVLFFTETFGTRFGMGYFIMDAWMRVNYVDMFSGILVLSCMGFLLFFALDLAESILCRWKT